MQTKNKKWIIGFVVIMCVTAYVLMPFRKEVAEPAVENENERVEIEIGNYHYSIPASYYRDRPDTKCNNETEALVGVAPDFTPHTPAQRRHWQFGDPSSDPSVRLLLEADFKRGDRAKEFIHGARNTDFENSVRAPERRAPEFKMPEQVYGLDMYVAAYRRAPDGSEYSFDDFFEKRDGDGMVTTYIRCTMFGTTMLSSCQQRFALNDLVIQASYDRRFLFHWKEIETNIRRVLTEVEPRRLEQRKPECTPYSG